MTEIATPQLQPYPYNFVYGLDEDGQLLFKSVGIEEIDYSGRFGAIASSTTENQVEIGTKYFVLDTDNDSFRIGDDVLIVSLDDPDCFMWGEIINSDTTWAPKRLHVYIDDISPVVGLYSNWRLQVVARPKPGIEKDTSTTSIDPYGAGPFTFIVSSGKFFPVGGTVLIKPLEARSIAVIGRVAAYSGTSLVVDKKQSNVTGSQSYDSWAIALLDAPEENIPIDVVNGLQMSISGTTLTLTAGSVRDSTDSYNLVLLETITKDITSLFAAGDGNGCQVQSANLAGTISSAALAVTGTGTAFLTDFGNIISSSGVTTAITAPPASDTSLNTKRALGATNATYKRGGWPTGYDPTETWTYNLILVRKDTDGSIDVSLAQSNAAGTNDLPTGYTINRALYAMQFTGGALDDVSSWVGGIGTASVITLEPSRNFSREHVLTNSTSITPVPLYVSSGGTVQLYRAALTGDVTASQNSNATTIADEAVTFAKMQHINPLRLVGRGDEGSAGDIGVLFLDDTLEFSGSTLQRAALTGDVTATAGSNSTTIANDAVTNAKAANMAAYTLKGRNAGTSGDPSDIDISALTEKTALVADDLLLIQDSAASNAFKKAKVAKQTTWTPALTFLVPGNLSVTYSVQHGYYTRVGDLVTLFFHIETSAFTHTTASSIALISGLPFTSRNITNLQYSGSLTQFQGITKTNYTQFNPGIFSNSNLISIYTSGSGQTATRVDAADMPTGGSVILIGQIAYLV